MDPWPSTISDPTPVMVALNNKIVRVGRKSKPFATICYLNLIPSPIASFGAMVEYTVRHLSCNTPVMGDNTLRKHPEVSL